VLGSEGFIGHHLVKFYSSSGYSVYGADLLEVGTQNYNYFKISRLSPELDELFEANVFDVCINAAGSGNVPYSMTHPLSDFESNSLDTIRLLDCIRRHQPLCKYLHISSAAVYGNPKKLPISETDVLQPISPYGWHKLIAEHVCKEFSTIYKIQTAIVRPFSVFGPGLKKQLFWDLFQKITKAEEGSNIELFGTGQESRDFIFIGQLVFAIDDILSKGGFNAECYNIASGVETTIEKVANLFVSAVGKPVHITFSQQERSGDPQCWKADISKIKTLGFKPDLELQNGIIKTAQWLNHLG
jgi:UDP-glucose 4-epimerase